MFKIGSVDKKELKEQTLYLESAFYIIANKNKESLYNTTNPYTSLKENSVSLKGYEIDCKHVLDLLVKDEFNVMSKKIIDSIKKDLSKNRE